MSSKKDIITELLDPNVVRRGNLLPIGSTAGGKITPAAPQFSVELLRSLSLPGRVLKGEPYTTQDATQMVLDTVGMAGVSGLLVPKPGPGLFGMNVFHGSPHKWQPEPGFPHGRPRLDMMDTGEGAQVYGHGFYAAQEPEVAKDYFNQFQTKSPEWSDQTWVKGVLDEKKNPTFLYPDETGKTLSREKTALTESEAIEELLKELSDPDISSAYDTARKALIHYRDTGKWPDTAYLYKLDLPDEDITRYLDRDIPLSQQSEHIRKALKDISKVNIGGWTVADSKGNPVYSWANPHKNKEEAIIAAADMQRGFNRAARQANEKITGREFIVIPDNPKGSDIISRLESSYGKEETANILKNAGIPGLKYYDSMSRKPNKLFVNGKIVTDPLDNIAAQYVKIWGNRKSRIEIELKADASVNPSRRADVMARIDKFTDAKIEYRPSGTRNYVTWDQDILDRTDVLQRNMDDLTQEVVTSPTVPEGTIFSALRRNQAFKQLAEAQRGDPELAMLGVQKAMGGGVANVMFEHIGDLTHRMSELYPHLKGGREAVTEKVKRGLQYLTHEYGFEREHLQNMKNNAAARGQTLEEYQAILKPAMKRYADEHRKLKVYNEPQMLARDAAVAIGENKWDVATDKLQKLQDILDNGDVYERTVANYDPDFEKNFKIIKDQPLPTDLASRMARAEQQGFKKDVFHGTQGDLKKWDVGGDVSKWNRWVRKRDKIQEKYGHKSPESEAHYKQMPEMPEGPIWVADPQTASTYAFTKGGDNMGPNVLPLKLRSTKIGTDDDIHDVVRTVLTRKGFKFEDIEDEIESSLIFSFIDPAQDDLGIAFEVIEELMKKGFKTVEHWDFDMDGKEIRSIAVLDPKNLRSRHAMFDPARINDNDLLAANPAPGSILLGLGRSTNQEEIAQEDAEAAARLNRMRRSPLGRAGLALTGRVQPRSDITTPRISRAAIRRYNRGGGA